MSSLTRPAPYPPWCEDNPELVELLLGFGQPLPTPGDGGHPLHLGPWRAVSRSTPDPREVSPSPGLPLESPPPSDFLIHVSSNQEFEERVIVLLPREEGRTRDFPCEICGPTVVTIGKAPHARCGHYEACTECQTRLVSQVMRCGECCRQVAGVFPVCDKDCESVAYRMGLSLSTTGCPLCGKKLAKAGCGKLCKRKRQPSYDPCLRQLQKRLLVMVLHPEVLVARQSRKRPCSHYSRCSLHDTITRGRAHPRCPSCRATVNAEL